MNFGKLISYRVCGQRVVLRFAGGTGRIELISPEIVNVFCGCETEEHHSYSIEERRMWNAPIHIEEFPEGLKIITSRLEVRVFDGFRVDVYDREGRLLCGDYRGERSYEPDRKSVV